MAHPSERAKTNPRITAVKNHIDAFLSLCEHQRANRFIVANTALHSGSDPARAPTRGASHLVVGLCVGACET